MLNIFESVYDKLVVGETVDGAQVIDEILRDPDRYTPTWHALGFIHTTLLKHERGTLRLHLWPTAEQHPDEQSEKVHDHLFSLRSQVLVGQVINEELKIDEAGANDYEYQSFTVKYSGTGSSLHPDGRYYKCREVIVSQFSAPEGYTVGSDVFHRTRVAGNGDALTLVATFGHMEKAPTALLTDKAAAASSRNSVPFDNLRWKLWLVMMRDKIASPIIDGGH